ncbi:MAG TPA: glycosyltransferase family 87 protein, partial [Acetobacteraceae bacterium]|nr:glycosyltransferase family 87 protein [Acetobacteraceae bacterium]
YPPTTLLFLWPAGALPSSIAYVLFMAGSLAACAMAMFAGGRVFRVSAMLVPALTAFMGNLLVGQTGFLSAALFVGGLRLAQPRPVLGGVLIGLLTCKPQIGLLLPLALAAAGAWRCMIAAIATTATLSLAASLAFGWSIWGAWLQSLPHYAELFDHELHTLWLQPTVTAFLRSLAAPGWTVDLAQGAAAALALGLVWRLCRHGLTPRAILGVAAATFLATPHAFLYDTVLLAGATLLYANERKHWATSSLLRWKPGWLVMAAMFLPAIALAIGPRVSVLVLWPVATLALLPRRDDVQAG